jgi:hypothetical protein
MKNYTEIIKEILEKEPTLNGNGLNGKVSYAAEPIPECEFWRCVEFLDKKTLPIKKINKKAGSSYQLKHEVEEYIRATYCHHEGISDAAFIAALLYRGIKTQKYKNYNSVHAAIKLIKEKKKDETDMSYAYMSGKFHRSRENEAESNDK